MHPLVSMLAAVVFLADAYVKWHDLPQRRITTMLFSFANAALIFAGFYFAGDPWSKVFAYLWVLDGILKIPGIDTKWEGRFRQVFSALMTTLLGLSLMFGIRLFGSTVLSVLVGWLVLYDAYVKWFYLKEAYFVVH
ncbi:TPA: hypothetical protein EYP13_02555 [Candidatus Micrarchaeota archaeon]|nr:hypothetical protein [Candidatus Micrarchaeota archaeon]